MNWRYLVGVFALMTGLAACGEGEAQDGKPACEAGDTLCGTSCVDTNTDERHCGACGVACDAGETCVDGACTVSCPAGQELCDGGCYDLDTDVQHCGSCGTACTDGQVCAEGACVEACPPGQELCDGGCFDLASSAQNCGACGTACGAGEVCVDGGCATSCPAGQEVCDGACFNLGTANDHCGACGNACGDGQVCVDGTCELSCVEGLTNCDGACTDLERDRANCGACDTTCGASELCVDGSCQLTCGAGATACDGACVDTNSDRANCGGCGITCDAGEICSAGACVPFCGGYATDVCDGACTNLQNDPLNCGTCGNACPDGQVCSAGVCAETCAPGTDVCETGCTDFDHDPANCGGCGNACTAAGNAIPVCGAGACENLCMPGYGDCNGDLLMTGTDGCETPLEMDPANCGGCGIACPAPAHGIAACFDGTCGIGQCESGWDDCDGDASNGCEVNVIDDDANCGGCGIVCSAELGEACVAGICESPGAGDICATALELAGGDNSIFWSARGQEYLTSPVSCNNAVPAGADLVLSYTATQTGGVRISIPKASSNLIHMVVSDAPCGTVEELRCRSDYTNAGLEVSFPVIAQQTYYVYLVRGTKADYVIPNPLEVTVEEFPTSGLAGAGENCANPIALADNSTALAWNATLNDYFDAAPSCGSLSYQPAGPDVVLKYTATHNGAVEFFLERNGGRDAYVVVQEDTCGTIESPLACTASAITGATELRTVFPVTAGHDYYIHVIAQMSGYLSTNQPLLNPFNVRVNPIDCENLAATITPQEPVDGTLLPRPDPEFKATLSHAARTNAGTVTLTGDLGTEVVIPLPSPLVTFSTDAKTVTIKPGTFFRSQERVTVRLDLVTADCGMPYVPVQWVVTAPATPCTPGVDGMVGNTLTRHPMPVVGSSPTEYYVTADDAPNGWVYVGGTSMLFRVSKDAARFENVYTAAKLGSDHLGYVLLVDGQNIYSVNESTAADGKKRLWRLSANGGTTWEPLDLAVFIDTATNAAPGDDFRGAAIDGNKVYLVTQEGTTSVDTEIWSVDLSQPVPIQAVKETSFGANVYSYCHGLAVDASSWFTVCRDDTETGKPYAVVRIPRNGGPVAEVITGLPGNTTAMALHGKDWDGDGSIDYLYFQESKEEGHFVCAPYTAPWAYEHFDFGGATDSYGMGFDPVENALWAYDDDTMEIVKVK